MTAKEMFEKLGWEYQDTVVYSPNFYYIKTVVIGRPITFEIDFKVEDKKLFIEGVITLEELKAINKQISELGWDND